MTILLNGEPFHCDSARTVAELIERHQLPAAITLVELNGEALHRRDWPAHQLQANDRVEILRVAAGG